MTSFATLPTTTGTMHTGGFSLLSKEPALTSEIEPARPVKRCMINTLSDSCKKRRKQSTPVRISAADTSSSISGSKLDTTAYEFELQCHACQLSFNNIERLQDHISVEHTDDKFIKEVEDAPATTKCVRSEPTFEIPFSRGELSWLNDFQNKDWMDSSIPSALPFSHAASLFVTLPPMQQPGNAIVKPPIRIFNPDAYCDLCNKEFCNKYFLKTHKANKHGIFTDPPTITEPFSTSISLPSFSSNLKGCNSTMEINFSNPETKLSGMPLNPFDESSSKNSPLYSNKMFANMNKPMISSIFDSDVSPIAVDFDNSSSGLCNGQIDVEPMASEVSSPKANIQDSITIKSDATCEPSHLTPPSEISPSQQWREIEYNRLRKIGVMNPKAFCEICCKEYCNKYFLRTHKMKRHGIFIFDDGKDNRNLKFETNCSQSAETAQTSPLNLIMAEQNNSSNSELKMSSPIDIGCDICGIKFQNSSLAQLHNVSVHSRIAQLKQDVPNLTTEDIAQGNSDIRSSCEQPPNRAQSVSDDLQKLQTMILQLNDLEVDRAPNTCYKDYESRFFIHGHLMGESDVPAEETLDPPKNGESNNGDNPTLACDVCNTEVQNLEDLKKHFMDSHPNQIRANEIKEENCVVVERGPTRANSATGQYSDRRNSVNVTPSSSYCEICNKELCNKYFMKTHMQRMHGIEIENGAQIGGVICDICNKELCSKYFLRVHKHNTHGIAEYGTTLLQSRKSEVEPTPTTPAETDHALKPLDLADLSHRYFAHFTEVCTICSRRFRSTKWLKTHLLSDHGDLGAEKCAELELQMQHSVDQSIKSTVIARAPQNGRASPTLKIPSTNQDKIIPMNAKSVLSTILGTDETFPKLYHCPYCSFSTPVLPFLFVHERSHTIQTNENGSSSLICSICSQHFSHVEQLQHHLFTQHPVFRTTPFFNGNPGPQVTDAAPLFKTKSEHVEDDINSERGRSPLESKIQSQIMQKATPIQFFPEVSQSLKDVAKRLQLPVTYAIPQDGEQAVTPGYEMQAFFVDEPVVDRTFVPSVMFLPVLQKLSAPITTTFTLTPT